MTKRKRDYKAEYRRRVRLAEEKGRSRSQARGHPRRHESGLKTKRPDLRDERVLERALRDIRAGKSLTAAAKGVHVSEERVRSYLAKSGIAIKKGRLWIVGADHRIRQMRVITTDGLKRVELNLKQASLNGSHEAAVGRFLETNDVSHLKPFAGQTIKDINGKRYALETNPNTLYRLANSGGESFEQIYRIISK